MSFDLRLRSQSIGPIQTLTLRWGWTKSQNVTKVITFHSWQSIQWLRYFILKPEPWLLARVKMAATSFWFLTYLNICFKHWHNTTFFVFFRWMWLIYTAYIINRDHFPVPWCGLFIHCMNKEKTQTCSLSFPSPFNLHRITGTVDAF